MWVGRKGKDHCWLSVLTVTHGAGGHRATVAPTTLQGGAGARHHLIDDSLLSPEVLSSHALLHLALTNIPHLHMKKNADMVDQSTKLVPDMPMHLYNSAQHCLN